MQNEIKRTTLHVTQDESGRWSLTLERRDGSLRLLAHSFPSRESLLEEAHDLIKNRIYRNADVKAEDPRSLPTAPVAAAVGRPSPRKVGEAPGSECSSDSTVPPVPGGVPVPNVPSKWVYWTADGAGDQGGVAAEGMYDWLYGQKKAGLADLIVYGGDVYGSGSDAEFGMFYEQIGGSRQDVAQADELLTIMCATTGNHDWHTLDVSDSGDPKFGLMYPPFPSGYENFWKSHPSLQPIYEGKHGGARYEHAIDLNGWRLIFLDTGSLDSGVDYNLQNVFNTNPWPMGDDSRYSQLDGWLDHVPNETTRANIVFAHHSRLSCGQVGDNYGLDAMWKLLFDDAVNPRAAFTLAGHDHNVSVYKPVDVGFSPVEDDSKGIGVIVNGAGGYGFMSYTMGTLPTAFPKHVKRDPCSDPDHNQYNPYHYGFCATQIELTGYDPGDGTTVPIEAKVTILGFGSSGGSVPKEIWSHSYTLYPLTDSEEDSTP